LLWHQGGSNAGRAAQYRNLLPTLIKSWRGVWGQGTFPFYIVELESWQPRNPNPLDHDAYADIREVQRLTAHNDPKSGFVVTYDIGDVKNPHPNDKLDLAHRLALVALAKTYGEKIEYSGPDFTCADRAESGKMTLHFAHTGKGLVASAVTTIVGQDPTPAGKLVGFQIAGRELV